MWSTTHCQRWSCNGRSEVRRRRAGTAGAAVAAVLACGHLLGGLQASFVTGAPSWARFHRAASAAGSSNWLHTGITRRFAGNAPTGVNELFDCIEEELGRLTPLKEELHFLISEGKAAAHEELAAGGGLSPFQDLLDWLQSHGQPGSCAPQSLGPIAATALRNPATGREVVVLGTAHGVPGIEAGKNPVPRAVGQAIVKLQPGLVAVELDRARGLKEVEKLPSNLWGRAALLFPEEDYDSAGVPLLELSAEAEVIEKVAEGLGAGNPSNEALLKATQDVYAASSDRSLTMNLFALSELRCRAAGDWGKDMTIAVVAAAKLAKPLLFCDFPQDWTLGKVVPAYNKVWVQERHKRLKYLEDQPRALRAMDAEDKIFADAVLNSRGANLPPLVYAMGLCRPGGGLAEASAKPLWLGERDPAMAAAVAAAVEGRARSSSGEKTSIGPVKRVVLVVGCNHAEGVAAALVSSHGYKVVKAPAGGWPSNSDSAAVTASRTKSGARSGRPGARGRGAPTGRHSGGRRGRAR